MSGILLDITDQMIVDETNDGVMTTEIDSWYFETDNNETDVEEDDFCSVPSEIFEDFTAEEFANTNTIGWMHSIPPRRGHSKNVMNLIVGTEAQKQGGLQS